MIPRNCLQCGGPLRRGSGPNEKWCSPAHFREWYLARYDYQPMPRKRRKLTSPVTGAVAELDALWAPGYGGKTTPLS
jgi:hypothetical protein